MKLEIARSGRSGRERPLMKAQVPRDSESGPPYNGGVFILGGTIPPRAGKETGAQFSGEIARPGAQ